MPGNRAYASNILTSFQSLFDASTPGQYFNAGGTLKDDGATHSAHLSVGRPRKRSFLLKSWID